MLRRGGRRLRIGRLVVAVVVVRVDRGGTRRGGRLSGRRRRRRGGRRSVARAGLAARAAPCVADVAEAELGTAFEGVGAGGASCLDAARIARGCCRDVEEEEVGQQSHEESNGWAMEIDHDACLDDVSQRVVCQECYCCHNDIICGWFRIFEETA